MTSALLILTGARTWTMKDGTPHPTGYWVREFMEAYQVFSDAGYDVDITTPAGVSAQPDPLSWDFGYNNNDQDFIDRQHAFLDSIEEVLASPLKLEDIEPGHYDILFVVGGHGPMQDLAVHPSIGELYAANLDDPAKIVAGVCHGPASFLSAHRADGTWLFRGRKLTGFTNAEETMATFAGNAPWLLEDRLRLSGAQFEAGEPYTVHVVEDGNLITGQQNLSSGAAASKVVERISSMA